MGSSNSPQINPVQNPGAQGISGDILSKATQYLDNSFGGNTPQQTVVGFNPYQQSTMDQLQGVLGQTSPLNASASGYINDVLNGKYLNPASNPGLSASADAISSGAQKFLNQNLDQIGSNFALAGGTSSSAMANAKKQATVATASNVGQSLAGLYGNAYSQALGQMPGAVNSAQSLTSSGIGQLQQALGLGGYQQQLQQQIANLPLQNYLTQMGIQGQGLSAAQSALGSYDSSFFMPQYAPSQLSQNLGMVFQGMNATGNLLQGGAKAYAACDRRLKNGIVKLGDRFGLGIYAFRYKPGLGLPVGERIGMMADEVARKIPAAVKAINDFLHVDYDLVFAEAI